MTGDDIINALLKPLGTNLKNYERRWQEEVIQVANGMALERDVLLDALRICVPANVCLTNQNIPDSTIVPLDVTMGDLRKIAQAIALASPIQKEAGQ